MRLNLMCSRLSIFQNIFTWFFHRSEIETIFRKQYNRQGIHGTKLGPVLVLYRVLQSGHGDQIISNFSNCLGPGSAFSRNLWDFVRGYLLKKRNYNAIMPHESLSRSLEYTNKIITMEVENHYVPRNELFWLANIKLSTATSTLVTDVGDEKYWGQL